MTTENDLKIKTKTDLSPPKLWKVLLLNDDVTPMELVIEILMGIFRHDRMTAEQITMEVHNTGSGIAGAYLYEIAEQKGLEATAIARSNGYPLKIVVEEEQ